MTELQDILDQNGNTTGRTKKRNEPLKKGEYNLGAQVWIINSKQEFLLTRRSKAKGHKWHSVGGMAVAGDNSITTALKEAKEEVGLELDPDKAYFFMRCSWPLNEGIHLCDVWIFRHDADISEVILQEDEACDAMWGDKEKIRQLKEDGVFVPADWYLYLEDLFNFCDETFGG